MDETCKQLIREVHNPIAYAPGGPAQIDHEYVRNAVAHIFLEIESLSRPLKTWLIGKSRD